MTDYTKLVKALRCKRDDCEGCDLAFFDKDEGWMCQYAAKDDDAADAIEALQAQLPKRGVWELIDGAEPIRWECSRCKYMSWETSNYCPRCGAKMEVRE
jgi:hypothetical protein